MTVKNWSGANGSFYDDTLWSPIGSPSPGDVAVINAGTVQLGNVQGVTIDLNQTSDAQATTLVFPASGDEVSFRETTLLPGTILNVADLRAPNPNPFVSRYTAPAPTLSIVDGGASNQGTINFTAPLAYIQVAGTLTNIGTINMVGSGVQFSDSAPGYSVLENQGTISVVGNAASPSAVALAITGQGTIQLGAYGSIQFGSSVAGTQLIQFNGGSGQYEQVTFGHPGPIAATITGFSKTDLIQFSDTSETSATYTNTGPTAGTLTIFSGSQQTAQLNFSGNYNLASFVLTEVPITNNRTALNISTTASEPQYGKLPPGFDSLARPVYRFFDSTNGTQFLTASTNERNTVQATRPDLVQEAGNYSAVAMTAPNAAPVYRFFDTKFGTHFFTASSVERDAIISNRSDLRYEPGSTFYEHLTAQSGDVAVYRAFETGTGTHFFTGNQAEYQSLTTPGSAGYRSDLVSEGVAFYAPSGTTT